MKYPVYTFDDDTDYEQVLVTVMQMSNDLLSQNGCCGNKQVRQVLLDASVLRRAIDDADDLSDTERWEAYIEASYKLLYPYASS